MQMPPVRDKGSSEKIHALTSLRFFAALNVVIGHTFGALTAWSSIIVLKYMWAGFGVAVSFFFFLSGYILAIVYLKDNKPIDKRRFFVARLARIYPLYFLCLILDTPFLVMTRISLYGWFSAAAKTVATFIAQMLVLQAWNTSLRGINFPDWSISVEALFYLCFPFIALTLWKLRGARLWFVIVMVYALGQALVWFATPLTHAVHPRFSIDDRFPLLHLSTFLLGILWARWQCLSETKRGNQPVSDATVYAVLVAVVSIFVAVTFFDLPVPITNVKSGLSAPLFAGLVWVFSQSDRQPSRILSANWLVVLGEASFGLYLIHIPVFHLLMAFHPQRSVPLYFTYLVCCVILSIVSFHYFETRMRLRVLRYFGSRPQENVEVASIAS